MICLLDKLYSCSSLHFDSLVQVIRHILKSTHKHVFHDQPSHWHSSECNILEKSFDFVNSLIKKKNKKLLLWVGKQTGVFIFSFVCSIQKKRKRKKKDNKLTSSAYATYCTIFLWFGSYLSIGASRFSSLYLIKILKV